MTHFLSLGIAFAEEVGRGLWSVITSVHSDIEAFCRYGEPS